MDVYFVIFIILIGFVGYAFFRTGKRTIKPFPAHWHVLLVKEVEFYRGLSADEQLRFQKRMMQFLSEVYIDSVNLEITELDTILIAASGVIPVFAFNDWHYNTLSGVILYPDNFNEDFEFSKTSKSKRIAGVVGTGRLQGKMIISKKALHHGFKNDNDGRNTAIHEFVHLIDKMDESVDGIPEILLQHPNVIPWLELVYKEMESISNNKSKLRPYGATNQAEFFAVASEYFFESPERLKKDHPELYSALSKSFKVKF
ncbi:zinc-dependent peptidase [Psychroserpens mesophilus]|uniref:M90 family metallopeptidase n=1 Tax=Psychroserpens mesophilus TaxID=325473 RepID=UPI003D6479B6